MTDIFAQIVATLRNQESVVLATIISSSGSSPLPPGSSLMVKRAGTSAIGTVGGGAVEASVIKRSKALFEGSADSAIERFELDENGPEGMICGGAIDVLIERIGPEDLSLFSQLIDSRDAGGDCVLLRGTHASKSRVRRVIVKGSSRESLQSAQIRDFFQESGTTEDALLPSAQRAVRQESVERVSGLHGEVIIQPIIGTQPLIIFGGGHVGRSLSRVAALSGYSVIIVDEREEYARQSRFPEATRTISRDWNTAFKELKITPATSIVIVTSGHKSDAEVLHHAATTCARYVGMIGSRKKVAATFSQLIKDGVPRDALQRVHAPIGLNIGSVTAEEIAVSILAELIRARRGFQDESAPLSSQMIPWFDQPKA
jgi:xanthine dehydrogenase accessory factor